MLSRVEEETHSSATRETLFIQPYHHCHDESLESMTLNIIEDVETSANAASRSGKAAEELMIGYVAAMRGIEWGIIRYELAATFLFS
jgi:hypothetical protein